MEIRGDLCHSTIIKNMKPLLSFDESKDFSVWKEEIKSKFSELIGYGNIEKNACPLRVETESVERKDGYTQTRFVFESEKDSFVPCYLLVPDTGKEKYPLAITMQGHSSGFHNSVGIVKYEGDAAYQSRGQFAVQAVKRGFAALAIEQRGMGERRPSERHQCGANMCEYEAHIALMLGRTIIGERIWDISRAIDAVKRFDKVDTEKILITGSSGGGTISYYAACLDERIKLSVPNCAFCPYPESIMNWFHCSCNFIPHAYEWFDMQDLAGLIAPRRLALVNGRYDEIFPLYGAEKGYETVKKIYGKANSPANCSFTVTDKAHWWCEDIVWDKIAEETEKLKW